MHNIRPKEAIEGAGISDQKLRHWKDCLPPLKKKRGNAPLFSAGDVLALRVIRWLTETASISVSRLKPFAGEIFKLCQVEAWPRVEHQVAILNFDTNTFETAPRSSALMGPTMGGAMIIDIGKLVTDFRAQYFETQPVEQHQLSFGPVPLNHIGNRQKRGGKRQDA